MASVLLDTHAWAWTLKEVQSLTPTARSAIEDADSIFVSVISLFEISQKVRIGKWSDMEPVVDGLVSLALDQGFHLVELGGPTALIAGLLDWPHRDPFDRMIAATAIATGATLISADVMFDTLDDARLRRVW